MTRNNFRKIILLQVALNMLTIFVGLSDFSLGVPESISQAQELYDENKLDLKSRAELLLMFGSYCLGLVVMIDGVIGLYFFKRWGIWLSVVSTLVILPIFNYNLKFEINDWVVATLTYWIAVIDGLIISVALFTFLKQEFK